MGKLFSISDKPMVIAGPCSIESEQQLSETAAGLSRDSRIAMMRCGVWKPRTRPGGFEGLGEPALRWIAAVKRLYPTLPFCCEVARPEHVELCQQYGIDAVWIGARTSVNPFLVGELAEALRGSGLAVMVKNPITPDISLWLGAIERIEQAGIDELAAVYRGFSTYNSIYFPMSKFHSVISFRRSFFNIFTKNNFSFCFRRIFLTSLSRNCFGKLMPFYIN